MLTKKVRAILAGKLRTKTETVPDAVIRTSPLFQTIPRTSKVYKPSWSIYGNAAANTGITTIINHALYNEGWATASAMVRNAGIKHFYSYVPWALLEPRKGQYSFDPWITQRVIAGSANLPVWLQIHPINTDGTRQCPAELMTEPWDSPAMISAFKNLITKLTPLLGGGKVVRLMVGNEADLYFATHSSEIAAYAVFIREIRKHVIATWGDTTKVSVCFTAAATATWAAYAAIVNELDFNTLTFYFIGSVDPPGDLLSHSTLTGKKEYVYQEIGFTSDTATWSSSEAFQGAILNTYVLGLLGTAPGIAGFAGATIFQLEDFSAAVLTSAGYVEPFLSFYRQIGLRTSADVAKAEWPFVVDFLGKL